MAQRVEDTLVGHLGHRWVGVNRVGDVLEDGPHLEGEGPLAHQFTDVGADALDAKDAMVVLTGHDSNKAPGLFRFLSQGATVGRQRKLPRDDGVTGFCLLYTSDAADD